MAVLGRTAVVVDAQVVNEQTDLADAHNRKARYYGKAAVVEAIQRKHNVRNVVTTSATLSWRDVWSKASAKELRGLGFIKTQDLKIVPTRVLIGNIAAFRVFNHTISVEHRRGIG